jgi:hypothetical protein
MYMSEAEQSRPSELGLADAATAILGLMDGPAPQPKPEKRVEANAEVEETEAAADEDIEASSEDDQASEEYSEDSSEGEESESVEAAEDGEDEAPALDSLVTVKINGKTQQVTQSYQTTRFGGSAPDYGSAINVDKDGVKGVEIGIPGLEFQIEKTLAKGVLRLSYVMTLVTMTYKTNVAAFMNFAAGELLFLGAEFRQSSNAEVTVVFKFSASPNRTGLTFGTISGVAKKGHEYLWIDYEAWETGGYVVRRPRGVYVERVYEEGDFALLGIL